MEGEAVNQAKWQPLETENDLQPTAGKATGTSASPPTQLNLPIIQVWEEMYSPLSRE